MSELTDRITEVLKAHIWYFMGNLGVPGMPDQRGYKCGCGWETHAEGNREAEDPHAHVAAAVADALQPEMDRLARLQDYYDNTGVYVAKSKLTELQVKP